MSKRSLYLCVITLSIMALVAGCKSGEDSPLGFDWLSIIKGENNKKCRDNVNVTVGGYLLSLARNGEFTVITNDRSYELSAGAHCEVNHIDHVVGIRGPGFGLSYGTSMNGRTTFQRYKNYLEDHQDNAVMLANGITKYSVAGVPDSMYVIPADKAFTYNQEPIVFKCRSSTCKTTYFINENVIWGFIYAYRGDIDEDFIAINKNHFREFEKLVVRYTPEEHLE